MASGIGRAVMPPSEVLFELARPGIRGTVSDETWTPASGAQEVRATGHVWSPGEQHPGTTVRVCQCCGSDFHPSDPARGPDASMHRRCYSTFLIERSVRLIAASRAIRTELQRLRRTDKAT